MANIKIRTRESAVTYLRRPFPVALNTLKSYVSDQDGFRAYVHRDVLEFIKQQAQIAGDDETVGLLTGRICQDPVHGPYTLVMAADGAREGEFEATPSHVKLLTEGHAKVRRRLESAYPDREIIGWYHSHPHCEAQFSGVDIKEQATWTDPNHIGIVYSGVDEVEPYGVYRGPGATLLLPGQDDPKLNRKVSDTRFLPVPPNHQLPPRKKLLASRPSIPTDDRAAPFSARFKRPGVLVWPALIILLLVVLGAIIWLNRRVSVVETSVRQLTAGEYKVDRAQRSAGEPIHLRPQETPPAAGANSPVTVSEKTSAVDSPEWTAQAKSLATTTTPQQPPEKKRKGKSRRAKATPKAQKKSKSRDQLTGSSRPRVGSQLQTDSNPVQLKRP